ncbi:hypothetical protein OXX69_001446 [Metschnikowia pulcherrima]
MQVSPGLSSKWSIAHVANTVKVISKNIQNIFQPYPLSSLCDHDLLMLQEVKTGQTDSFTNNEHFSSFLCSLPSSRAECRAAVLAKKSLFGLIESNVLANFLSARDTLARVADLLVRVKKTGEVWLVVSVYAPTGKATLARENLWASINKGLDSALFCVRQKHPNVQIVLGGDFNDVMDDTLDNSDGRVTVPSRAALRARQPLADIIATNDLRDCFRELFPNRAHGTNNAGQNCSRRLDRIYVSPSLRLRLYSFGERREANIASTHVTLRATFLLDSECPLQMGRHRFSLRHDILISETVLARIRSSSAGAPFDCLVANAKSILKSASYEAMCRERSGLPPLAPPPPPDSQRFKSFHATQALAFKPLTKKPHVFEIMVSADGRHTATTTNAIIRMAWKHCSALYDEKPFDDLGMTKEFFSPWKASVPLSKLDDLDRPFTADELYAALKGSTASSPGEDGLTFAFWQATWEDHGELFAQIANDMMQGHIPKRMSSVIIDLVPKRGTSKSINDLRPLAIQNCSLRIICSAINKRLLTVANDLIGPHQFGFLPGRRMDESIAQFRKVVELLREAEPEDGVVELMDIDDAIPPPTLFGAPLRQIALVDFHKAFDSISHSYISKVLSHINLPVGLTTAIMTILRSQTANLWINRMKSHPFPIRVGTLQGNPFSPFLFVLALEPLLCGLNNYLRGLSLTQAPLINTRIKLSAFADDLTVFLGSDNDTRLLREALQVFAIFAGCSVNAAKSMVVDMSSHAAGDIHPELQYPWVNYDDATFNYLGYPNKGYDWSTEIHKLVGVVRGSNPQALPPVHRAHAVNTFVYSKIYYRDLHTPMQLADIKQLCASIKSLFPFTLDKTVFNRIENGGYGCLDVRLQLLGKRAKVIHRILFDPPQWFSMLLRCKIQVMLIDVYGVAHDKVRLADGRDIMLVQWWQFLLGWSFNLKRSKKNYRTIPWREYFSTTECAYLDAWFELVMPLHVSDASVKTRAPTMIKDYPEGERKRFNAVSLKRLIETWVPPVDDLPAPLNHQSYSIGLFTSVSKRHQLAVPKPRTSKTITSLAPTAPFDLFWKAQKARIFSLNMPLAYTHAFHLGLDVCFLAQGATCWLCDMPLPNSTRPPTARARHVYFECAVTKKIWSFVGLEGRPTEALLIARVSLDSIKIDKFFFLVNRLLRLGWTQSRESRSGYCLEVDGSGLENVESTMQHMMRHYNKKF